MYVFYFCIAPPPASSTAVKSKGAHRENRGNAHVKMSWHASMEVLQPWVYASLPLFTLRRRGSGEGIVERNIRATQQDNNNH